MPPQYTQPSIPVTRAVLLEKSGHKTVSEKHQWVRDHNIIIHTPNSNTAVGYRTFTGTGQIAMPTGINTPRVNNTRTGNNNIGTGYSFLTTFTGVAGNAGYTGTITGGYTTVGVRSFSTFITQQDYDKLGKVGFKKWSWNLMS